MIKSVQISNFQSHKSTKLKLDPGVNAIVGPSDCGKSAILRAMFLAISNRPSGDSFKSYWGGDTSVDIELEDKTISREKGKENLYSVSPSAFGSMELFKAFGTGVPEEISSLFNISNINIQRQMDAPFLLSSTPGEVGRILNQAVRLDIIDKAQSNINSSLKQEKNSLLNTQNIIADKQEELEKYKWLPKAEGCIVKLETIASQISRMASFTMDLSKVIDDINIIDSSMKETSPILAYSQEVSDLINLDNSINIQTNLWNDINDVIQNIIADEKKIKSLSKLVKAESQIDEMIRIHQSYTNLKSKRNKLDNLIEDIIHNDQMLLVAKDNINKRQQEFEVEMPDICPLCSQQISHKGDKNANR
jgi:exonuclease SbcC